MSKRVRPKVRKHLGKRNPQIDVFDEWEELDIDRNEQKEGLKRREKRWKEIKRQIKLEKHLERKAIKNAEKMEQPPRSRQPTPLEEAWLRCDYVLWNTMTQAAYNMLEYIRVHDPAGYKYLYKKLMSKNMMNNISQFVDFFANEGKVDIRIPKKDIIYFYVRYRGYRPTIKIKHKGEEEHEI